MRPCTNQSECGYLASDGTWFQFCEHCTERLSVREMNLRTWGFAAKMHFKNYVAWGQAMGALAAQLQLESNFDRLADNPLSTAEGWALTALNRCIMLGTEEARNGKL